MKVLIEKTFEIVKYFKTSGATRIHRRMQVIES